jgi:hypothetical protein
MTKDKWTSLLVGVLLALGIGLILWFVFLSDSVVGANAKPPAKVDVCHIDGKSGNSQTLNLPPDTATKEHLDIHDLDYLGVCAVCGSTQYDNKGTCVDKVAVCDDEDAENYNGDIDERTEVVNNEVCEYPQPSPTPTPKPVKDYCKNFEKDQKEVPYGMVSDPETRICSCAEGYHQVDEEVFTLRKPEKEYDTFTCELDEPEVTPVPPVEHNPAPEGAKSTTETPVCTDGNTQKVVANLHVVRAGSDATVNYFITEGNTSNIYYRLNSSGNWEHSVMDVKGNSDNYVSYTIHELQPTGDYTFGVEQVNGCGGGNIASTTAVVVDSYLPQLFRVNYYQ